MPRRTRQVFINAKILGKLILPKPKGGGTAPAWYVRSGTPVNGTTLAGEAHPGSLLTSVSTNKLYINTNTRASPTWTVVGTQAAD